MLSLIRQGDMSTAVYQLQNALKQCGAVIPATGKFDEATKQGLISIQYKLGLKPDGVAGPATIQALKLDLRPTTIRDSDFSAKAAQLKCDPRTLKAICQVEAPRGGFQEDGRPVILYERHYFDRHCVIEGGLSTAQRAQIRVSDRDICWPSALTFKKQYPDGRPIPASERYGPGALQYPRLNRALAYSGTAALMAASWGKFQIMGENALRCGWTSVQAFVRAMEASERDHLDAMVAFLYTKNGLVDAVRTNKWSEIARLYNGPSQVAHYAPKLQAAFRLL